MTNPNNEMMTSNMHHDISNHKPTKALLESVSPLANLLEEYVFNNSYHSPLDMLLTTYCPLDFQFTFEVCPPIIEDALLFKKSDPDTYSRLESIHKAGRASATIYVMDKLLESHPAFYMDWQDSGLSIQEFSKQYAEEQEKSNA